MVLFDCLTGDFVEGLLLLSPEPGVSLITCELDSVKFRLFLLGLPVFLTGDFEGVRRILDIFMPSLALSVSHKFADFLFKSFTEQTSSLLFLPLNSKSPFLTILLELLARLLLFPDAGFKSSSGLLGETELTLFCLELLETGVVERLFLDEAGVVGEAGTDFALGVLTGSLEDSTFFGEGSSRTLFFLDSRGDSNPPRDWCFFFCFSEELVRSSLADFGVDERLLHL